MCSDWCTLAAGPWYHVGADVENAAYDVKLNEPLGLHKLGYIAALNTPLCRQLDPEDRRFV